MNHYHHNGDYCSSEPPPDAIMNMPVHPIPNHEVFGKVYFVGGLDNWLDEEIRISEYEWMMLPEYAKPIRVSNEKEEVDHSSSV